MLSDRFFLDEVISLIPDETDEVVCPMLKKQFVKAACLFLKTLFNEMGVAYDEDLKSYRDLKLGMVAANRELAHLGVRLRTIKRGPFWSLEAVVE